jgi:hypothetical protein
VLGPALLRWIAVEDARSAERSANPQASNGGLPVARRRAPLVWGTAVALVAMAVGVALGREALGRGSDAGPKGPCDRPAATLAVDRSTRVVRAGAGLYACWPGARPVRLGPSAGPARPAALRIGGARVVYAEQRCGAGRAGCAVAIDVLRLADRRRFVRARFARSGPVTGLAVSPRGALGVMLGPRCARGPACGSGRLVLIDARGTRVADAGRALDTRSLAAARTTVLWRHGGRAASAELSG